MEVRFMFDEEPGPQLVPPQRRLLWQLATDPRSVEGAKSTLRNPSDVAFVADDFFVASDSDGHRLAIFDNSGRLVCQLAERNVWPSCVAVTPDDKIVVTDRKTRQVQVYDVTGQLLHKWGDRYSFPEEIECRPHGVAVNSRGQVIVTDTALHNCSVYSPEGKLLFQFGDRGKRVNQLLLPFYCTVDLDDNILISDNMNYCVKKFDPAGNFLLQVGSGQDWGKRQFLCPYGVCVDADNNIIVADKNGCRVSMFTTDGQPVGDLVKKSDQCQSPCGVAINSCGKLLFSEANLDYTNLKMYQMTYPSSSA